MDLVCLAPRNTIINKRAAYRKTSAEVAQTIEEEAMAIILTAQSTSSKIKGDFVVYKNKILGHCPIKGI